MSNSRLTGCKLLSLIWTIENINKKERKENTIHSINFVDSSLISLIQYKLKCMAGEWGILLMLTKLFPFYTSLGNFIFVKFKINWIDHHICSDISNILLIFVAFLSFWLYDFIQTLKKKISWLFILAALYKWTTGLKIAQIHVKLSWLKIIEYSLSITEFNYP